MKEYLTDRSQRMLDIAFQEAKSRGHAHVGVEHILLGLVREGTGVANSLLAGAGVSEERILAEIDAGERGRATDSTRLSEGAKRGLMLAQKEAELLGQKFIGPDTIVLGVLRTEEADSDALTRLGIDAADLRDRVLAQLQKGVAEMRRSTTKSVRVTKMFTKGTLIRLDPETKKVMGHSRRLALEFDSPKVGSEHLLLALFEPTGGQASAILRAAAISDERLRELVKESREEEPGEIAGEDPISGHMKEIIELATQEADDLDAMQVTPEHLLLALLKHDGCAATRILHDLGADLHYLCAKVDAAFDS